MDNLARMIHEQLATELQPRKEYILYLVEQAFEQEEVTLAFSRLLPPGPNRDETLGKLQRKESRIKREIVDVLNDDAANVSIRRNEFEVELRNLEGAKA